jgi:predicted homoserine dehydrogenase-like protein
MFKQALDRWADQGRPIQVGFVSAGRMGTDAICQIGLMKGIRSAIIADINTERVVRAFELCGHRREDVVVTDSAGAAADAIRNGKPVATQDAEILSELPIDVVVEATGNPDIGARVAMRSILARKHVTTLYYLRAMQDAGGAGKFREVVRARDRRPEEPRKVAAE